MPATWIAIVGQDLDKVLAKLVQNASNENIGAEVLVGLPYDSTLANRRDAITAEVVEEFRGAIDRGNRVPLSVTAGTVPPECVRHALNLAAYQLVNSSPNLQMAIMTDGGVYSPLAKLYTEATVELKRISAGGLVSYPTDPEDADEAEVPDHGSSGDISGDASVTMVIS